MIPALKLPAARWNRHWANRQTSDTKEHPTIRASSLSEESTVKNALMEPKNAVSLDGGETWLGHGNPSANANEAIPTRTGSAQCHDSLVAGTDIVVSK